MKKRGHYCKICGEYKSNEKFSGKGHAAHICKTCASLPPEKKSEMAAMNRLLNLPWRLSKEQISWLKKKMHDKRPDIRALAKEQYEMRFSPARFEEDEPNGDFTGHGFGADDSKCSDECRAWKNEFLIWLKSLYGNGQ